MEVPVKGKGKGALLAEDDLPYPVDTIDIPVTEAMAKKDSITVRFFSCLFFRLVEFVFIFFANFIIVVGCGQVE